jgi:hypothetical protein
MILTALVFFVLTQGTLPNLFLHLILAFIFRCTGQWGAYTTMAILFCIGVLSFTTNGFGLLSK